MSHTEHHITSLKTLSIVFGALVFLTVFTVFTAQFDLGAFNVPLALAIALTKASLVVLIFMALIWDNKVNAVILAVGCLFVVVFISFILLDTEYRGDLSNTFEQTLMDERLEAERAAMGDTEAAESQAADH
ncbi:MAG: cytochrome C oxidase subunit IV family protein [Bacteroidetes bacterium]|nr:cytochrome C oxidase subunit IV family protein [Bacteroidota bacterium]